MTAKDYLRQVRTLDLKIESRTKEKEDLRERAMCVSAVRTDGDKVTNSGSPETFEGLIAKVADMEAEVDELVDEFVTLRHRIIGEIHGLEDPRYIQLLTLRYIDYMNLDEIGEYMHYSYEHTRRLHGEALQEFESCYTMLHNDTL